MKKAIWLLALIVVILGIGLFYSIRLNVTNKKDYLQRSILYKRDQNDLKRMNTFYERFLDQKADYLVIIGPTIDSGPAITNIHSNGKDIVWIYDNSRDVYSNGLIGGYKCKKLYKEEEGARTVFSVSNCEGYLKDDIKGRIAFTMK